MAGAGILSFHRALVEAAHEEGFPLAGAVDIDLAAPFFQEHVHRYDAWLAAGYEGAMEYLRRGRDRRADPRLLLPGAESVFVVALPYPAVPAGTLDVTKGPRYARYLRRNDYHGEIAARLERVMKRVVDGGAAPDGLSWKVCVDTSAVLERAWALLAGLGWIGKNSLLIHPQHGSYLFLGEVLLTSKTGQGPRLLPNYCGNCERCLRACPTNALIEPGVLAANRCIAYWTLEKRGELMLDGRDRAAMGTWIAGCDICQEVCPFNSKAARAAETAPPPDDRENGALALGTWQALLEETEAGYKDRIRDSALSRVKPAQFRRNLALALTNAIPSFSSAVKEKIKPLIERKLQAEPDEAVRREWSACLKAL
ncbi:MAG: tRNA epoxyqueuosine(34) reductase QueG [Oligoflexia bacterium]|nr:tRNA epoxyqueuosine(34) reductase QueG [Oligoflexia bacterium]